MIINGDWKNKVRTMRANGDDEGAKRELRKAKMSKAYKITNYKNKFFIDYCLAHHSYTEENIEMCKNYLKDVKRIFNSEDMIESMKLEYCKYLWMNTNLNYKNMSTDEICKTMYYISDYYSSIDQYDIAISAVANIYSYKKDGEKVLEKFEEFLNCDKISDYHFVESFLRDCDKMDHNLYIKANELLDKYKINIDAV